MNDHNIFTIQSFDSHIKNILNDVMTKTFKFANRNQMKTHYKFTNYFLMFDCNLFTIVCIPRHKDVAFNCFIRDINSMSFLYSILWYRTMLLNWHRQLTMLLDILLTTWMCFYWCGDDWKLKCFECFETKDKIWFLLVLVLNIQYSGLVSLERKKSVGLAFNTFGAPDDKLAVGGS